MDKAGMIRKQALKLLVAAGFSITAALPTVSPAWSQGTVKNTYGSWSMICDTPAGATSEQCALNQRVAAEEQPDFVISIFVLRTADNKAEIMRVLTPLGVLLPSRIGLFIDGKDKGGVQYYRCFVDGCYADAILAEPLITELKTGTTATFTLFQTPEEGIGIPVDLKGLAEGFAALPK